jgi:adenylyl cyclase-associated protein
VNGEIPLVSVDKTDGIQVYLSEKSRAAEIVTAKSSEMNILVPGADGDFVSLPSFVHAWFLANYKDVDDGW